ncbi:hypothetical protein ACB092_11G046600 [Castanea dentata]
MKDKQGRTALHIAAYCGHYAVMEKILSSCPDCSELVDDERGWSALHLAVKSFHPRGVVRIILEKSCFRSLWNEKDADGNTALHHASNSSKPLMKLMNDRRVDFNNIVSLFKCRIFIKKVAFGNLSRSKRAFRRVVKVEGEDTIVKKDDIIEQKFMSRVEKAAEAHLVVAALIAIVTFTAGITVPGGFVSEKGADQGFAIMRTNVAFKAFLISNSIAMVLSTISAFI